MHTALKELGAIFKRLTTAAKKCRSSHKALTDLAAFNGGSDAMAITLRELDATAEQLVKDARAFAKAVADLANNIQSVASGVRLPEEIE